MRLSDNSSLCIERDFGFSKIKWQIKNYFPTTCKGNWNIDSPTFTVKGNQTTKWRLYLEADSATESVLAYLERLECDNACVTTDPIWVSWKLFFSDDMNETTFEAESDFEKKKAVGIEISDIAMLEKKMSFKNNDMLVIACWMMVHNKDSKIYGRSKDLGLRSLSQDLQVLFKVNKHYDVKIYGDGVPIKAHKAVLCIRNKVLKSIIVEKLSRIVLADTDLEAMKNVIGYLYTGNLDYVLRKPSFEILKCIQYLEIKELESYYKAEELTLCSEYDVQEYSFNWLTPNFKASNESCLISPIFTNNTSGTSFRIYFYVKGFCSANEQSTILVEIVEGTSSKIAYLELAITDHNGNYMHSQRTYASVGCDKFGFKFFISQEILEKLCSANDGNLSILCTYRSSTGITRLSTVQSKLNSDISISTEHHYKLLSNHITALFETGMYSDVTIICEGEIFKVHSYILSARSHIFKNFFTKYTYLRKRKTFRFPNIQSNILRAVLHYAYSGKLMKHEIDDILQIYSAAERFYILPLKYRCSSILQANIKSLNISEISDLAEKSKDYKLKASVLKFICSAPSVYLHKLVDLRIK